jgi:Predicted transcriptional regulator
MGNNKFQKQTVNTHLRHLIEKGFVRSEGEDRKHLYYPLTPRAEYDNVLAAHIVEQLFDGSLKKFVAALTSNRSLTSQEICELKALIKKRG